jgi:hypothetical protein
LNALKPLLWTDSQQHPPHQLKLTVVNDIQALCRICEEQFYQAFIVALKEPDEALALKAILAVRLRLPEILVITLGLPGPITPTLSVNVDRQLPWDGLQGLDRIEAVSKIGNRWWHWYLCLFFYFPYRLKSLCVRPTGPEIKHHITFWAADKQSHQQASRILHRFTSSIELNWPFARPPEEVRLALYFSSEDSSNEDLLFLVSQSPYNVAAHYSRSIPMQTVVQQVKNLWAALWPIINVTKPEFRVASKLSVDEEVSSGQMSAYLDAFDTGPGEAGTWQIDWERAPGKSRFADPLSILLQSLRSYAVYTSATTLTAQTIHKKLWHRSYRYQFKFDSQTAPTFPNLDYQTLRTLQATAPYSDPQGWLASALLGLFQIPGFKEIRWTHAQGTYSIEAANKNSGRTRPNHFNTSKMQTIDLIFTKAVPRFPDRYDEKLSDFAISTEKNVWACKGQLDFPGSLSISFDETSKDDFSFVIRDLGNCSLNFVSKSRAETTKSRFPVTIDIYTDRLQLQQDRTEIAYEEGVFPKVAQKARPHICAAILAYVAKHDWQNTYELFSRYLLDRSVPKDLETLVLLSQVVKLPSWTTDPLPIKDWKGSFEQFAILKSDSIQAIPDELKGYPVLKSDPVATQIIVNYFGSSFISL